jgi:SNF2 family DNA or RNA helicase
MLGIIEEELNKAHIRYVKLTGQTQDRETPMRQFQNGEVPVFLISLKAGGSGLTLTAADTVIHYDPWWNPAAEAQASDRAHRIGQTKPVFIHKLICQSTIEERILDLQKTKAALIEGLLSGRSDKLQLTQEDIQRLLTAS